jgi:hypothetical protein
MNRPRAILLPRPTGAGRRSPRTRTEAAVELVRVEFDAARLEREVAQASRRAAAARADLDRARRRARLLSRQLCETGPAT